MNTKVIAALRKILAGDLIQLFPTNKKVDVKKLDEVTKEEWANIDLKKIRKRFKDRPDILKALKGVEDPASNKEPYKGGLKTNWSPDKTKTLEFPLPTNVGDLEGVLGKDVLIGGSDPFNWADSKYKVTKKLLEKNYDKPLEIHTRSDLIAHDDYIAVINPAKHKVYMHIASTYDEFNKLIERGMPSVLRRLGATNKLKSYGIKVIIAHDTFKNPHISEDAKNFNRLDEIKLRSLAKGVKVEAYEVKLNDKGTKLINEMAEDLIQRKETA